MKINTTHQPVAILQNATLRYGPKTIWQAMDLEVQPGEFLAVLGPNGAGKSSLLKVLLGLQELTEGTVEIAGATARRGNPAIGYIPQQRTFDASAPLRGRDLVGLGLAGHRWGIPRSSARADARVEQAVTAVGAQSFASKPIGTLSGGEQQRLRVAQALVTEPQLLLCDEPLLSLDLASQQRVSALIDQERSRGAAVVFVTHEINPILSMVDRVLYIVGGKWKIGRPQEVLTSQVLSELYGAPVEVLRVHGRLLVMSDALPDETLGTHHHEGEIL